MRTLEEIRADINIAISEGNESSLRELVVELESHDSTEADALSARTEGDVCFLASDFSSAIACMEKARGIYSVLGDSLEEAGVALRIAEFLTRSGDPLKARVVFEESHAVYTRLEDRVGEASSLTGLGTTYMNTGDYQQALEVYEKATTLFNDVNDNAKLAKVVVLVGTTYMHMREYAKACQNLERAQSMFREMGLSSGEGEAVYNLGVLYYHSSQLPLALEYFEQALALYRQAKSRQGEANAIVCLGNVYKDTGDLARALEYYEKALECYSQIGARSGEAAACANLGSLKQRQGQFEQAEAYIMQAIRLQVELGRVPEAIHSMSTLCSLLLMQGDYTRAKDVLDRQETMYPSVSVTHSLHHIHRASLQVHDGELLKGQEHLQTALEIAKAANLPSVESLAHFELRNLSQKLNDFQAYIQHNEAYVRINEEINGKEATQKLTMMEAERKIRTERQEREKERAVLYSTLPKHVADRVIRGETISDHFEQAAVFFSDIVGFTSHSSEMDAPDVVRLLETL
ncbi:MAG: tetratricopeptide repeat protein, partial [Bradyrhizobiaceae bacterium]|nr:tetratricopeptide repeat protein [Bradyrhizobiaceae bacterium]